MSENTNHPDQDSLFELENPLENVVEITRKEQSAIESNEPLAQEDGCINQEEDPAKLMQEQIDALTRQVQEFKDLYIRAQAEIQNTQRRAQDEVKKSREYAITNFVKELVVVKDYLEMALKDESNQFDTLKMGVDLTLKQLVQVFEQNKVKEIAPEVKTKLDPNFHQAISSVEVENQESNTIVSVMQKGYILNDRVIRPAMVTVAK